MEILNITNLSLFQLINIVFFGIIFGSLELITNSYYILSKNSSLPRKQHGLELPNNASDDQVFSKVKRMIILGSGLLLCTLISLLVDYRIFIFSSALIMVNGLIDFNRFKKKDALFVWTLISTLIGVLLLI